MGHPVAMSPLLSKQDNTRKRPKWWFTVVWATPLQPVLKGPVQSRFSGLFLKGPGLRLVLESFRTQKLQTETAKKHKKLVQTGPNWSLLITLKHGINWQNSVIVCKNNCSLIFYVNFKVLIINIGGEINKLCHIL